MISTGLDIASVTTDLGGASQNSEKHFCHCWLPEKADYEQDHLLLMLA
jgi:hypothetical protein